MAKIRLLILFLTIVSCESKEEKIISTFSNVKGKKWYCYSIDSSHRFYPYRVREFYSNGKMKDYINVSSTGKLELIPRDNMWNTERWFVTSDLTVSIESVLNPKTGYYHKSNRKILYMNKDSIILQGSKNGNFEGVMILTRYEK